ncbi:hypothetical protein ACFQ4Q_06785 [Lysobacter gummosus]|uniref:hypothetical protein n=1 Tax=Lysobacter gummosus TaxID=262324 RepID=UPI003633622B
MAPARDSYALVAFDSKQPKAFSLVTFFVALDKESDPPLYGGSVWRLILLGASAFLLVIPAKAGIQCLSCENA